MLCAVVRAHFSRWRLKTLADYAEVSRAVVVVVLVVWVHALDRWLGARLGGAGGAGGGAEVSAHRCLQVLTQSCTMQAIGARTQSILTAPRGAYVFVKVLVLVVFLAVRAAEAQQVPRPRQKRIRRVTVGTTWMRTQDACMSVHSLAVHSCACRTCNTADTHL